MPDKSPHKTSNKKPGKTIKEKRAEKKSRKDDHPPIIPPTGH